MFSPFENTSVLELNRFLKYTIVSDNKIEALRLLVLFIHKHSCSAEVELFLECLLYDEKILNKLVIVNQNHFYQTVFDVTKTTCVPKHGSDPFLTLKRYRESAEQIFINLIFDGLELNALTPPSASADNVFLVSYYVANKAPDQAFYMLDNIKKKKHFTQSWRDEFLNERNRVVDFLLDRYNAKMTIARMINDEQSLKEAKKITKVLSVI